MRGLLVYWMKHSSGWNITRGFASYMEPSKHPRFGSVIPCINYRWRIVRLWRITLITWSQQ